MNSDTARLEVLAFRVPYLSDVEKMVSSVPGWKKNAMHSVEGKDFLEAGFGGIHINFFETAIYDEVLPAKSGHFLHVGFTVPNLDAVLENPDWKAKLAWGPRKVKCSFGDRYIAFFDVLPGCRIELIEDLDV